MRKLELKDIVGYLPYRLKGLCRGEVIPFLIGTHYNSGVTEHCLNSASDIKPLLRPMSDLTKPLEDGTMPIVELAKIAFKKNDFVAWVEEGNCFVGANNKSYSFLFSWSNSQESFSVMTLFYSYSKWRGNIDVFCPNQLQLFDYLNSHLFDYRGLIGEGLAIDINTLNQ